MYGKRILLFSGVPTGTKEVPDQAFDRKVYTILVGHLRMEGNVITPKGSIRFISNEAATIGYAIGDAVDLLAATEIAKTAPYSAGGRTKIRPC